MSVRLNFDSQELSEAGAQRIDDCGQRLWNIRLTDTGSGRPYLALSSALEFATIPAAVDQSFIKEITAHEIVDLRVHRHYGEYQYQTARAIVTNNRIKDASLYSVMIEYSAKNLEDIRKLHQLICSGLIWPAIDYDAPMAPSPARHLKQLLQEAWAIICRDVSYRFHQIRRV